MNYIVFYDIIRDGCQGSGLFWNFLSVLFILVTIGIVAHQVYKMYTSDDLFIEDWIYLAGKTLMLLFVLALLLFMEFHEKTGCESLVRSVNDGEYKVAEGRVKNVRMSYGRINRQYFSVDGVEFIISDNTVNGGFNRTILDDGPLYENRLVKLRYLVRGDDRIIVRIEVIK